MSFAIRPAEPRDLPLLPEIERSADGVFGSLGIVFPPGPAVIEEVSGDGTGVLVVGDPPVGFAALIDLDGHPHLEQMALEATYTGRGLGVPLLERAIEGASGVPGGGGLTLITFREVRWNAPWYARYGFTEWPEAQWGPQLRAHWQAEIGAGLHRLGPRLVMRHPL